EELSKLYIQSCSTMEGGGTKLPPPTTKGVAMPVSLEQLWIPILASAAGVFIASSLIHMVFKWHNSEYRGFKNEDEVRAAVRANSPAPGMYVLPYCSDMKDLQKPEMQQKFKDGPIGFFYMRPSGVPTMGPQLGQWFALNVVVAILAAYLASRTLPNTASFLQVCREVSIVVFLTYAGGSITHAIWMGKPWSAAAKEALDAFIYGALTAVIFAWLWPR